VNGKCSACAGTGVPKETLALVAGVTLLAGFAVFALRRRRRTKTRKIAAGANIISSTGIRTKFKILASYYQIVSQFERIFQIRFPRVFENFSRLIGSLFDLDFLQLGRVGCYVKTTFYSKLVFSTLAPIALTALIFVSMKIRRACTKDRMRRKIIRDHGIEFFLGMTFLVFSSVSTTVFDTFNCRTFGDDPTRYLYSDRSISCDEPAHSTYMLYACGMMVVFPLGIPVLYTLMLTQRRHEIQSTLRHSKASLIKTSFLWEMYEPKMWWFEILDCVRRLAMTGLLVFIRPGSTSQIVVAMLLAMANGTLTPTRARLSFQKLTLRSSRRVHTLSSVPAR
jgi:hypothetical protein